VWSLSLRRAPGPSTALTQELTELVREGRAAIIGPIRQELLSGIKATQQYDLLRGHLRAFPDLELTVDDFELAATFFNRCRARGIQGSNTDFLICAAASRRAHSIFTPERWSETYNVVGQIDVTHGGFAPGRLRIQRYIVRSRTAGTGAAGVNDGSDPDKC
jgi:predicted nucleic acid-binding protein